MAALGYRGFEFTCKLCIELLVFGLQRKLPLIVAICYVDAVYFDSVLSAIKLKTGYEVGCQQVAGGLTFCDLVNVELFEVDLYGQYDFLGRECILSVTGGYRGGCFRSGFLANDLKLINA